MSENDLARWVDLVETTLKDRLDELTTRVHNKDGVIDESLHYLVSWTIINRSLTSLKGSKFHYGADYSAHTGRRRSTRTDTRRNELLIY